MSFAWQITDEDVRNILHAHGVHLEKAAFEGAAERCFEQDGEVEHAALHYVDLERQTAAAYDVLEDILIETGVLNPPKRFAVE